MKQSLAGYGMRSKIRRGAKKGFTLVELLVVMAIIGVLVGITVPAVFAVRKSFELSATKWEVDQLANAIEQYRAKYGEYPPDGSSWPILEAHYRRAFPHILQSELDLLNPSYYTGQCSIQATMPADIRNDNDPSLTGFDISVFDRAEALVFALGGFSSDTQRPFTGKGGPFIASPGAASGYVYNTARSNSFYDFPTGRLSVVTTAVGVISNDEEVLGEAPSQTRSGVVNDLMPVFLSRGKLFSDDGCPYVYFDSRTYQFVKPSGVVYANFYEPGNVLTGMSNRGDTVKYGAARPYLSDSVNANIVSQPQAYANADTFQLLSPGGDGAYGGRLGSAFTSAPVLFAAPSGFPCAPDSSKGPGFYKLSTMFGPYVLSPEHMNGVNNKYNPGLDNASNFVENRTFGESR